MRAATGLIVLIPLNFLACIAPVKGLSCFCESVQCKPIDCCDSGFLTTDSCGCCDDCAKAVGDVCGGPWRVSGQCAPGLACLKTCDCKAFHDDTLKPCIFPFNFEGRTYTNCTTVKSENKLPWCAVKVDANRNVIFSQWGDCEIGCPGTDTACDEGYFFNAEGQCEASSYARSQPTGRTQFDEGITTRKPIRKCNGGGQTAGLVKPKICKCAAATKDIAGCSSDGNGWCFLENIQNPCEPSKDCYGDVTFSAADGRFWSSQICKDN